MLCAGGPKSNNNNNNNNKKHLKNVGPIHHYEPPHAHSPGVASGTVARRLRIDVHDNDDDDNDNDNAWQRGPLWPHGMGPIINISVLASWGHDFGGAVTGRALWGFVTPDPAPHTVWTNLSRVIFISLYLVSMTDALPGRGRSIRVVCVELRTGSGWRLRESDVRVCPAWLMVSDRNQLMVH